MNRTSLAATTAVAACLAGCMDYGIIDIKDPPPPPPPSCLQLECPVNVCTYTLDVDMGLVDECYGYDPATGTWATTPPAFLDGCNPDDVSTPCEVNMGNGAPDYPHPACMEADASTPTDVADCHYDNPVAPADSADKIAQLASCVGAAQRLYASDCFDEGPPIQWGDSCTCPDDSSMRSAGGGNVRLTVDPDLSYVRVMTPAGSGSVALSGSGFADTVNHRLLGAKIAATTGLLAGSVWSGWTFSFDKPLVLTAVGDSFRVPAAQHPKILGTGLRDGDRKALWAILGHDAVGHFHASSGTWDVDYADVKDTSTLVLHIAGRMSPVGP